MLPSTSEPPPAELLTRLQAVTPRLARDWIDRLTAEGGRGEDDRGDASIELAQRVCSELVDAIARAPAAAPIPDDSLPAATAWGERRFAQRASVTDLLRDYEILEDVVARALADDRQPPQTPGAVPVADAARAASAGIARLRGRAAAAFVARHIATIEQQTTQLRSFARLVSHEIRQPLGVLQVVARALPVKEGDLEAARMLDILNRNVARLTEVTGRLERLARLTRATDVMPGEQRVDLAALAADVVHRLADMAAARDVRLRVDDTLPELLVDAARTELVLMNLVSNGIKFSDPAKPRRFVQITARPDAADPTVLVQDNGIGLSADRLQHIFREFVRAHPQRDEELGTRGLGLGLLTVRECMDAMGGTVRIHSREGEGTTFTLTWPRRALPLR